MRKKMIMGFMLASMFFSATVEAQGLNKCVDANGKVTYSDQECPGSATSHSINTVPAAVTQSSNQSPNPSFSRNMKSLYACDQGKKEACFEKEAIEKRCHLQSKEGKKYSDCAEFGSDRNKYLELRSSCKNHGSEAACATLYCLGGDAQSCERMNAAKEKNQDIRNKQIESAAQRGLPSGAGWFMSQDWSDYGDGSKAAIITCNGNKSVALKRPRDMNHRILTGVTGSEFFLTVEDAARKACAKV
jgi:hypothetical protein